METHDKIGKVIAHAPAKINLALEVEPLRAGEEKHRLNSVFCTTSLADTLVFGFESGKEPFNARVMVRSTDFDVAFIKERDNIVIKAVELFKLEYGFGFLPSGTLHVELVKSIPAQAGLGGGSSDGAAMLRMLCWLAQVDPLSERSLSVARTLGADVPFFLHAPKAGLCALMTGYGDELVEVLPKPQLSLALVKPERGVSTKKAYEIFDTALDDARSSGFAGELAKALREEKALDAITPLCSNNLEPAAVELLLDIAEIKAELKALPGVLGATMCGSGSTLFAICESPLASQSCVQHFYKKGLWAVSVQT